MYAALLAFAVTDTHCQSDMSWSVKYGLDACSQHKGCARKGHRGVKPRSRWKSCAYPPVGDEKFCGPPNCTTGCTAPLTVGPVPWQSGLSAKPPAATGGSSSNTM